MTSIGKLNEAANGVLFSCTKKEILVTSLILEALTSMGTFAPFSAILGALITCLVQLALFLPALRWAKPQKWMR
jgi:hypothetical protein